MIPSAQSLNIPAILEPCGEVGIQAGRGAVAGLATGEATAASSAADISVPCIFKTLRHHLTCFLNVDQVLLFNVLTSVYF